jgi:hypothetical protein
MPKPEPRKPRPAIEEPSLLVLHEKHGDLYFHVPNEAALFKVALDIVEKRLRAGHWYLDPKDYEPKAPSVSKEQADALPDGPVKKAALQELSGHVRAVKEYRWIKEGWELIHKAVKEKDGRLAWKVLRDHSDGEYQRVTVERYEDSYYEYK